MIGKKAWIPIHYKPKVFQKIHIPRPKEVKPKDKRLDEQGTKEVLDKVTGQTTDISDIRGRIQGLQGDRKMKEKFRYQMKKAKKTYSSKDTWTYVRSKDKVQHTGRKRTDKK